MRRVTWRRVTWTPSDGWIHQPVDFGAAPVEPAKAPPAVGADTQAVLRELGLTDSELDRLRKAGVIV